MRPRMHDSATGIVAATARQPTRLPVQAGSLHNRS